MDPWSNHLNQAYGRLPPGTGLSANSTFHLLAEQQGFGSATGLGASLANPLPAHAAIPTAARFSGLSHMNYGALHGSMTQLFDPMALSQGFASGTSPYKTVPVVQTMYSLDPATAVVVQNAGISAPSPHDIAGRFSSQSSQQGLGDGGLSVGTGTSQWNRSSSGFPHAAPANPYEGLSGSRLGSGTSSGGSGGTKSSTQHQQEPPPAHSGSRHSGIHRSSATGYQNKDYLAQQQPISPPPQQSAVSQQRSSRVGYEPAVQDSSHNVQRLANLEFIQKVILDGQKLTGDSGTGMGKRDNSRNPVGYGSNQRATPSQAGRSVQQSQQFSAESQQLSSYNMLYSDRGSAGSSGVGVGYSASTAEQHYDTISSQELLGRDSGAALLSQQSLSRFAGMDSTAQAMHVTLQDAVALAAAAAVGRNPLSVAVGTGGDGRSNVPALAMLPVQAQPDSTTKPKRSRNSGKGGNRGGGGDVSPPLGGGREGEMNQQHMETAKRKSKGGGGGSKSKNKKDDQPEVYTEAGATYAQLVPPTGGFAPSVDITDLDAYRQQQKYQQSFMSQVTAMFQDGGRAAEEPQVFLTNMYGSSFVNPNEVLGIDTGLTAGAGSVTAVASVTSQDSEEQIETRMQEVTRPRPVPSIIDEDFGHLTEDPGPQVATECAPPKAPAAPAAPTGFMNSFLSFVSGKKPDTLQTASAGANIKKPVLPKYIPDITPRKTVVVEAPKANTSSETSPTKTGITVTGGAKASTSKVAGSPPVKSLTGQRFVGTKWALKDDSGEDTEDDDAPVKRGKGRGRGRGRGKKVGLPTREKTERKAKTDQGAGKSGKKKSTFPDSDEEGNEDDFSPRRSKVLEDSDPDDDPAWKPGSRKPGLDLGVGLEAKRGRGRQPKMVPPKLASHVASKNQSKADQTGMKQQNSSTASSATVTVTAAAAAAEGPRPHNFERGNFVIDRKDLDNYLSYPIWKIDSARLLQRYEATEKDGRIIHRALSTYSSWSDSIEGGYKAIDVLILSTGKGPELVEVLEQYRPKRPTVERLAADDLQDSFNVFVQILVSQSLEPNFLNALLQEPDEYYMNPLHRIEGMLTQKTSMIAETLGWKLEFLNMVNKYSGIDMRKNYTGQKCEIVKDSNKADIADHEISLYGPVYDHRTLSLLEERNRDQAFTFAIDSRCASIVGVYHSIQHIKWSMCKTCANKILEVRRENPGMADHEVLDRCLQTTDWMQQLFQYLTSLLDAVEKWKKNEALNN